VAWQTSKADKAEIGWNGQEWRLPLALRKTIGRSRAAVKEIEVMVACSRRNQVRDAAPRRAVTDVGFPVSVKISFKTFLTPKCLST